MQFPFKKSNAEGRVMMEVYMGRRVEQVTFVLGIVEVSQWKFQTLWIARTVRSSIHCETI